MAAYFFYGTLMDPALLCRLLGARARRSAPAVLQDHRRVRLRGQPYPTVVPAAGEHVEGILVEGIDPAGQERLADYEGPAYAVRLLVVTDAEGGSRRVRVFVAPPALASMEEWRP